jgi:hypothetical protein
MHTSRQIALSLLALVLALAAACEPVYFAAELHAPEVCVTGLELAFPAAIPGAVTKEPVSIEDLGVTLANEVGLDLDLELEVEVVGVGMAASEGVSDFDFLDLLRVRAALAGDAAGELPMLELVEMDPGDRQQDGALYATPDQPVDLAGHLRHGDLALAVDLEGRLPEVAWRTELDLCVRISASHRESL